jgi:hypothetical protein
VRNAVDTVRAFRTAHWRNGLKGDMAWIDAADKMFKLPMGLHGKAINYAWP